MKKIITILLLTMCFNFDLFSQKKGNTTKAQSSKPVVATTSNTSSTTLKVDEMFTALNYYDKPPVVNNNAALSISYSPFAVFVDMQNIKAEVNGIIEKYKITNSKELFELANMKYRNHNEYMPMDGSFNVMFIRPDQNINPRNVVKLPTNKITANLKYKLSK
jgi:hypothetical protein